MTLILRLMVSTDTVFSSFDPYGTPVAELRERDFAGSGPRATGTWRIRMSPWWARVPTKPAPCPYFFELGTMTRRTVRRPSGLNRGRLVQGKIVPPTVDPHDAGESRPDLDNRPADGGSFLGEWIMRGVLRKPIRSCGNGDPGQPCEGLTIVAAVEK